MSRKYVEVIKEKSDWSDVLLARLQLLIPSWDQGRPVGVYNI